jgi:chemotaxis protein methyltransferase CheR
VAFTFFFRDLHVLELIVQHVVPSFAGRTFVRIWDAGCAAGQETYTLAILLAEHMNHFAFNNVRIYATDIDESGDFGRTVREGVYRREELERVPGELVSKYFEPGPEPGFLRVVERLRARVVFQRHDLLSLQPIGYGFSLILCKNVLLHFRPEQQVEVVRMFHQALAPGGYFATEHTQKLPASLAPLFRPVVAGAQLFQKIGLDDACAAA